MSEIFWGFPQTFQGYQRVGQLKLSHSHSSPSMFNVIIQWKMFNTKTANTKYSQGPVRKGHFTMILNTINANKITRTLIKTKKNCLGPRIKFTWNHLIWKRGCSHTRYGDKGLLQSTKYFYWYWNSIGIYSVVLCLFRRLHSLCTVSTHPVVKY
jgi:hypothetical protein